MYTIFIIAVVVPVAAYGTEVKPSAYLLDGRIVGGENTSIGRHPHHVSVRYLLSHYCGGSIIKSNVILTAAHCTDPAVPPFLYSVQFGVTALSLHRNVITAKRILRHEDFNEQTFDYDIALIFLLIRIPYSKHSRPIALASQAPAGGSRAIATGWGSLSEGGPLPRFLQQVEIQIVLLKVCKDQYKNLNTITAQMICAGVAEGGRDSCQGDSGGPLVVNGQQVGIVSWGYGCARRGYSGVYSNVANLQRWVAEKSGGHLAFGFLENVGISTNI